jgi:hypothetical protein
VFVAGVVAAAVVGRTVVPGVAERSPAFVPATDQALAALAVEVLELDPDIAATGSFLSIDDDDDLLGAHLQTDPAAGYLGRGLYLGIAEDTEDDLCDDFTDGCATLTTPRGDVTLSWMIEDDDPAEHLAGPEEAEDPFLRRPTAMYGVSWIDPDTDDLEYILHQGDAFEGDPRDAEVPFPVDDLVRLLTDERFGRTTTQELVDVELPGWMTVPDLDDFDRDDFDPDDFNPDDFDPGDFNPDDFDPGDFDLGGFEPGGSDADGFDLDGFDLDGFEARFDLSFEPSKNPLAGDVTALVEEHLGVTPKKVDGYLVGSRFAVVDIRLPGKPRHDIHLQVNAERNPGPYTKACDADAMIICATWQVPAGAVTMTWMTDDTGQEPGLLQLNLKTPAASKTVSLWFVGETPVSGDPRDLDLPISVDQLVALLSDPGVAMP